MCWCRGCAGSPLPVSILMLRSTVSRNGGVADSATGRSRYSTKDPRFPVTCVVLEDDERGEGSSEWLSAGGLGMLATPRKFKYFRLMLFRRVLFPA
jgi:hypothetical protein